MIIVTDIVPNAEVIILLCGEDLVHLSFLNLYHLVEYEEDNDGLGADGHHRTEE